MSDSKSKYVVVFDVVHVPTGEVVGGQHGVPPISVMGTHVRADEIELDAKTAERLLADGAIVKASDPAAKGVTPNEPLGGGVKRDTVINAFPLDQVAPAEAGAEGATRRTTTGGKLGTKAELERMKVGDLKALAATHDVEVEGKDTKRTLAAKLAKVRVDTTETGDELNPGQGKGESPPPEHQPGEPPDEK